jgi:flagellar biosynthesis GTPase FlhF
MILIVSLLTIMSNNTRSKSRTLIKFDPKNPKHIKDTKAISSSDEDEATRPPRKKTKKEDANKTFILFGDDNEIDPKELDEHGNIKDLFDYTDSADYAIYKNNMESREHKELEMMNCIILTKYATDDSEDEDYTPSHKSKKRKISELLEESGEESGETEEESGETEEESGETEEESDETDEEINKMFLPILLQSANLIKKNPKVILLDRVRMSNIPDDTKAMIIKKIQNMDSDSNKQMEWLESILSIPFGQYAISKVNINDPKDKITNFFENVNERLSAQVYGLLDVKQEIINYLGQFITAGINSSPRVLALHGSAGVGKCLSPNTPVLMWNVLSDKTTSYTVTKLAKDVKVGDRLVGDDNTYRNVLSVCTGKDTMYRIIQENGDSYTVNGPHILSLKIIGHKEWTFNNKLNRYEFSYYDRIENRMRIFCFYMKKGILAGRISKDLAILSHDYLMAIITNDDILDISVEDYLKLPEKTKKCLLGYKTGIDFKHVNIDIDPYVLGSWLGYKTDQLVCDIEDLKDFCNIETEGIEKINNPSIIINKFARNLIHNRYIPVKYMINSRSIRLQILAGLLDNCGISDGTGGFYMILYYKRLVDNLKYLIRSLGFYFEVECIDMYYNGEKTDRIKYKCVLDGMYLDTIPCKIINMRNILNKTSNRLIYQIKIEKLDTGPYCGFTLDGNHRFLLGDFTVTHNTYIVRTALAEVLDRPLRCINMGGIKDSQHMIGFDYTYSGSRCGVVVQTLIDSHVMNPIILFEEVDKISETKDGMDIQNLLMHLTDPEQNKAFHDKYFAGIDIDMSKAICVFTLNNPLLLHPILLNRLHLVKIPDPTIKDKINIGKSFMTNKLFQNIGIDILSIEITDDIYEYILTKYCKNDKGLRTLKHSLESILLRLNTIKLIGKDMSGKLNISFPLKLTTSIVDCILLKDEIVNEHDYSMYM